MHLVFFLNWGGIGKRWSTLANFVYMYFHLHQKQVCLFLSLTSLVTEDTQWFFSSRYVCLYLCKSVNLKGHAVLTGLKEKVLLALELCFATNPL